MRCIRIHTNIDLTKVRFNSVQYNMPYSMHRLFRLKEYKPGALVLGAKKQKAAEQGLYDKGERPDALID